MIVGPTFEEMLHPTKIAARSTAPLNPINLFNITGRDANDETCHVVLPRTLTGLPANIVGICGKDFPTGSHKVDAAHSVLLEKILFGEVALRKHRLVWPSTGNYGNESNIKEIYDNTKHLRAEDPNIRVLNQFEVMGYYRAAAGSKIGKLAA